MTATENLEWATYAFNTFDELRSVSVAFGTKPGLQAWVAISNFEKERWDLHGPFTDSTLVSLHGLKRADNGNLFIAIVAPPGTFAQILDVKLLAAGGLPVAKLPGGGLNLYAGDTYVLDGSESYDPDGPLAKIEWDLDGDGNFEVDSTPALIVNLVTFDTGELQQFTVALRVTDSVGNQDEDRMGFSIYPHSDPRADFWVTPRHGAPGDPIEFNSDPSSDGMFGTIVKSEWDLNDDGEFEYESQDGSTIATSTFPNPAGRRQIRLRVTDDEGNQATISRTISSSAARAMWSSLRFGGLKMVNGHPALACRGWTGLKYVRALDADGVSWPISPTELDLAADFISLAVVEDRPSIAYSAGTSLNYIAANDDNGDSWLPPVEAIPAPQDQPGVGYFPLGREALAEIDGKPAILFGNHPSGYSNPAYISAINASGSEWNAPVQLTDSLVNKGRATLAMFNGAPACFLFGATDWGAVAFYAQDVDGLSWGFPIHAAAQCWSPYGAVINGNPMFAYMSSAEPEYALSVKRSLDSEGEIWSSPLEVLHSPASGFSFPDFKLGTVGGIPCLVVIHDGQVKLLQAAELDGSAWGEPVIVASIGGYENDAVVDLVDLNGTAGVLYRDGNELWFDRVELVTP